MEQIQFTIIKDIFGERITATINETGLYINSFKDKTFYKKIRKMIGSNNKTLALLNIKNESTQIREIANLILYKIPYQIKYIDFTVTPTKIQYRKYDGTTFS